MVIKSIANKLLFSIYLTNKKDSIIIAKHNFSSGRFNNFDILHTINIIVFIQNNAHKNQTLLLGYNNKLIIFIFPLIIQSITDQQTNGIINCLKRRPIISIVR